MLLINDISDHLPTITLLKQKKLLKQEPLNFESRCLNDKKMKVLNHQLMRKDWIDLLTGPTCDEKFNQFSNILTEVLDEVAPIKKVRISSKRGYTEPWMTKGLEHAGKTKLKLYRRCLEAASTEEDRKEYTAYQNVFNNLKRNLKTQYYQRKCDQFKDNAKKLWALINDMIRKVKHRGSIISYIKIYGKLNYTPKDIANGFGRFYSTLGSKFAQQIVPGMTTIKDYIHQIPRQHDSMVMRKTTPMEIDAIIKKLPSKASHGRDEVSNIMIKALRTSIVFPLCHIFNHSIMEGKFPTRMKLAEVIPLYKGKSMDQMVNYTPISLLIMLSKLLEKVIYQRIYKYLEAKSILYPSQYGFCNKRSCEQAICELTGYILQSKNRSEHSASIYLDLSKAFDTLDHNILLHKLDWYGIRRVAKEWIEDYLRNRSLVTKITTCPNKIIKSESFSITCGTAQGSCLRPLLFIIFMNDLHLLPLYSMVIIFADDTAIFNSHKTRRYPTIHDRYRFAIITILV